MKVAIVHEFLTKIGGAEKVLLSLHKIYPDAPIYTLVYSKKGTKGVFEGEKCNIIESHLKKYPDFIKRRPRLLLAKYPEAIESFDLSGYDLVISSSNSFAHGVLTRPATLHISYCHSPMRYAWDWAHNYLVENRIGYGPVGFWVRKTMSNIRMWDRVAAHRVDAWIANSTTVQSRIQKYYRAQSSVIYPPVSMPEISQRKIGDYYIIVSRLSAYKKIETAMEAFSGLDQKLIVIGAGSDSARLKKLASKNVEFLGWQDQKTTSKYMSECKALIFPGEDDFGLTPVEAQSYGRPVIAANRGGALETVIEGKTGLFFNYDDPADLKKKVLEMEDKISNFDSKIIRAEAEKFSEERFAKEIRAFVESKFKECLK